MARKPVKKISKMSWRFMSVVAWAVVLVGSVFGAVVVVDSARTELLESFKYENRSAVETMVSNINQIHNEYEAGVLNETEARQIAVSMVQNGVWNNGKRGFWAIDSDGTLVAKVENGDMTYKPGDNVWNYQDADGKYVEREIVASGQNGGGFVEFRIENEAVNNTYIAYVLATDFGFVVDATFDMNYFNQYWSSTILPVIAQSIALVVVCLILVMALVASVLLFNRKK